MARAGLVPEWNAIISAGIAGQQPLARLYFWLSGHLSGLKPQPVMA
jgi:hypothetical protein